MKNLRTVKGHVRKEIYLTAVLIFGFTVTLLSQATHTINVSIVQNPCTIVSATKGYINGYFKVYPNPFHQTILIEVSDEFLKSDIYLSICGVLGGVVAEKQLMCHSENNVIELNLDELPAGFYIIKIRSKNVDIKQKLIKR